MDLGLTYPPTGVSCSSIKNSYDELTEDQRQNVNQVDYTTDYDATMPSRITVPMIATVDRYMLIPNTQLTSSSSQCQTPETSATPETGNIDDSQLDQGHFL